MAASASMIITLISAMGSTSVTSVPVDDLSDCRKEMVAYVEDMPDAAIQRKGTNFVSAYVDSTRVYVKCQPI